MGEGAGPERPAFYALAPGGWRDWWTLLHPPYTAWHLSYVVIGASLAPDVNLRWLGETVLRRSVPLPNHIRLKSPA